MNCSFQSEDFEKAFKKLKGSVFYEKTAAVLRYKIAQYEIDPEFEKNLEKLRELILNQDETGWNNYTSLLMNDIGFLAFPKKMELGLTDSDKECEVKRPNIIRNFGSSHPSVVECQFFAEMPVEIYLLGILWVMYIGAQLDEKLVSNVYGNRVRKANGRTLDRANDFTPYLFEPYFIQYEAWRDGAIEIAERAVKTDKESVRLISLDLKSFFYHVQYTQDEWANVLEASVPEKDRTYAIERLHRFCFDVFAAYAKRLGWQFDVEPDCKASILPIGFAPSLVAANWCLQQFDKELLRKVHPLYYGRYVDDILIVVKRHDCEEDRVDPRVILSGLLDLSREKIPAGAKSDELIIDKKYTEAKASRITFQPSKTKVFEFDASAPYAMLTRLKEEIRKNSSEFKLMPDINGMSIEDSYAVIFDYQIEGSPNKIRDVKSIELDKFEFSKYLGCLQKVLPVLDDNRKEGLLRGLVDILDNSRLVDCYSYWERIVEILICAYKLSLLREFICKIARAIEDISWIVPEDCRARETDTAYLDCLCKEDHDPKRASSPLLREKVFVEEVKRTLRQYFLALIVRASVLVWDKETDEVLESLLSRQIEIEAQIDSSGRIFFTPDKAKEHFLEKSNA